MSYSKYKQDIYNLWRYPMGETWPPDDFIKAISLYVACVEHGSIVGLIADLITEVGRLEGTTTAETANESK